MELLIFFLLVLLIPIFWKMRAFRRLPEDDDLAEPPLPREARGFAVVTEPVEARPADAPFGPDAGPGRYRVVGVVRQTQSDITTFIEAQSLANAMVKADLRGIIVTEIVKE